MEHRFVPDTYYMSIGSHDPVLRVGSGDLIHTVTVDAGGRDFKGNQVAPRGNPQTGPFYVEGALPGDVLAVTLNKVWPNRDHGFCRPKIAASVLEPGHENGVPTTDTFNFLLDFDTNTAAIENPSSALEILIVPFLTKYTVSPYSSSKTIILFFG